MSDISGLRLPKLEYTNWFWETKLDNARGDTRISLALMREVTVYTYHSKDWFRGGLWPTTGYVRTTKPTPGWVGVDGTLERVQGETNMHKRTNHTTDVVDFIEGLPADVTAIELAAAEIHQRVTVKQERIDYFKKLYREERENALRFVGTYPNRD